MRTAKKYASGSIKGAINLGVTSFQFQEALKTLKKDKEYYVFCRSGKRSGVACSMLTVQGFKAYNLAGGIGV